MIQEKMVPDPYKQAQASYLNWKMQQTGPKGITPFQQQLLEERKNEFSQRQQNFQQAESLKSQMMILADEYHKQGNLRAEKVLRERIQAWEGSNPVKSFFGFGPTEDSTGGAEEDPLGLNP